MLFNQYLDFLNYLIIEIKEQKHFIYFYKLYEEFIKKKII